MSQEKNSRYPLARTADAGDYDDNQDGGEAPSRDTQCGLGAWRPSALQSCANVRAFTAVLALWSLFGSMNFTYYTAVITQIERHFGLSSSMTGFIKNVDNIGYMLTVVLFSHFFRYSNKPRLFAAATLISSSAIFLFGTPYFFFGAPKSTPPPADVNSTSATGDGMRDSGLCGAAGPAGEGDDGCGKGSDNVLQTFHGGALGIFILSELIQGIGQSPKFTLSMTYLDDNAKNNSPKYFAYMFSMRAFSPVMGFLLGAWTTSIYVDLSKPSFGPKDPRWVGAWWLGFVICAAVSIVWAVPMLLFPSNLKDSGDDQKKKQALESSKSFKEMAKDLPNALVSLLKNKLYMMLILAICVKIYNVGFMTFLPKYLQLQFGITASLASILTAVIGACSWALGPIVSGQLVSKLKAVTPFRAMKMVCIIMSSILIGYFVLLFLGCPTEKWAGDLPTKNLTMECNSHCSCEAVRFQPVCGDDGVNYYSPCHAGCTLESKNSSSKTVFTDCKCIPSGLAVDGVCGKECSMIYPYAVVLFLTSFVASMAIVPTMTLLMRSVPNKDKATSLAIATAIMQVVAFPAPMLGGFVIDTACIVHQESACSDKKGACLLYDSDQFRLRMHGYVTLINALACFFYFLALFFSRNVSYEGDDEAAAATNEEKATMMTTVNGDTGETKETLSSV